VTSLSRASSSSKRKEKENKNSSCPKRSIIERFIQKKEKVYSLLREKREIKEKKNDKKYIVQNYKYLNK